MRQTTITTADLIRMCRERGCYVESPPDNCTGYVFLPGEIRHDGDTCPIHEIETA